MFFNSPINSNSCISAPQFINKNLYSLWDTKLVVTTNITITGTRANFSLFNIPLCEIHYPNDRVIYCRLPLPSKRRTENFGRPTLYSYMRSWFRILAIITVRSRTRRSHLTTPINIMVRDDTRILDSTVGTTAINFPSCWSCPWIISPQIPLPFAHSDNKKDPFPL